MIPYDRNEDIKIRGKNTLVYDHNDLMVTLSQAKMWYSDGKYLQPIEIEWKNKNQKKIKKNHKIS